MLKHWIFQANPQTYDIIGELQEPAQLLDWTVRQHREDVRYGDTAFIWKADGNEGNPGIYAVAKVISDIIPIPDIFGKKHWKDLSELKVEPRVIIRYIKKFPVTPLLKASIITNPVLKDLQVLKQPQGTVFEVTNAQADELNKIISRIP